MAEKNERKYRIYRIKDDPALKIPCREFTERITPQAETEIIGDISTALENLKQESFDAVFICTEREEKRKPNHRGTMCGYDGGELIQVKSGNAFYYIPPEELLYAAISSGRLTVVTKRGRICGLRLTLDSFIQRVGRREFQRCQKSFAANMENVAAVEKADPRNGYLRFADSNETCQWSYTHFSKVRGFPHLLAPLRKRFR